MVFKFLVSKKAVYKPIFISIIILLILAVSLASYFVLADEPEPESDWVIYKRTATKNILVNTKTRQYQTQIGRGIINLDKEDRRFPNYIPRSEFFRNTTSGYQDNTGFIYKLSNNKKFINVHDRYDNYMSSFGFAITGIVNGENYKVSSLDYDWTWSKDINETTAYFEGDNNANFHWIQRYYLYKDKPMKIENYVDNNVADVTNAKFWYIQTVNQNDSVIWNGNNYSLDTTRHLEGNYDNVLPNVEFPDYYVFNYRDLIENGFNITDIYIGEGTPIGADGEWILAVGVTKNNGNFPKGASVTLDPTITLQDADTENLEDTYIKDTSADTNYGSETNLISVVASVEGTHLYNSLIKFNLSSITSDYILSDSSLNLYVYSNFYESGDSIGIHLYNTSSNWVEDTLTWNNQPANYDFIFTNDTLLYDYTGWMLFDVLIQVNDSVINNNISFMLNATGVPEAWGTDGVYFYSKEYTTDTSLRPYLNITYTPYIDIITPTPAQTFTEDEPTANFNVTTAVAMDACRWTPDSGVTNYSMTNYSAYNWTLQNTSMIDGNYEDTIFYCNDSSTGNWYSSDTVSFDVDSVNVTVCRDLNVQRTYYLRNDVSISGDNCFLIKNDSVILDLSGYSVTGGRAGYSGVSQGLGCEIDTETSYNHTKIMNGTIKNFSVGICYYIYALDNSVPFNTTFQNLNFYNTSWAIYDAAMRNATYENIYIENTKVGLGLNCCGSTGNIVRHIKIVNATTYGIAFDSETYNPIVYNVTVDGCGGDDYDIWGYANYECIYMYGTTGGTFTNITLKNSISHGLELRNGADNNRFVNLNITNISYIPVRFSGSGCTNNSFVNVSMNTSANNIETGELLRKWYFTPQINESGTGTPIQTANVTIYNVSDSSVHSENTDVNGQIGTEEIIEYINNGGTKTYATPHTINVSKTGWVTNSTIVNLTIEQNYIHNVNLVTALSVNIDYPTDDLWLDNNVSTNLNFTLTNSTTTSCLFTTDDYTTNTSITNCQNTTFNRSDGNYLLKLWANDSSGTSTSDEVNFTIDTTYPLISYSGGTETDFKNVSQSNVYVNVSVTETNEANITFYLFNSDNSLNTSTTYTDKTHYINWTGLSDGFYYYNVTIVDNATNTNSTATRKIGLDNVAPDLTLAHPKAQSYSTNLSLSLNYTVSDTTLEVDSCWYRIVNSTGDIITSNTTISNCANITFNVSQGEGTFTLTLYANDTVNNVNSNSVTFGISITAPSIVLDYPTDNLWFNSGQNIYFNFTATDSDGLDTCELWGNWTGTWHKNYTWVSPETAVMNYTILNLTEVKAMWNVWCNDTNNLENWALNNFTFGVDTIYPDISINYINTVQNSKIIIFNTSVNDTNTLTCKYSIFYTNGSLDGVNENITFTCGAESLATVRGDYGIYNLTVYATDPASNENSSTRKFTIARSPVTGGGGGPEPEPEEEEIIEEFIAKGICGNGLCEAGESFYNCPEDCGEFNIDDLILSCFSGTNIGDYLDVPDSPTEKAKCVINQSPVLFYLGIGVIGFTFITILLRTDIGKKYQKKIYAYADYQPKKRFRRKSWLRKYVK